ncbi:MAG TPA: sigma-70 family RNA polymerase sigma factor [Polyangiaceae bacterium]|jgi:RNA polymerase sigma-70 factor (ECF subfamily)|nr:sigma-70 family RNA polymerase sigma factor [Polyangiaceae bacterium]
MDPMGTPALRLVRSGPDSGPESTVQSLHGAAASAVGASDGAAALGSEPAEPADADLVSRVHTNDRFAFEQLYRRHCGFALGLAVRLSGSRTDVEDLVHDAFLRARVELATLRDPAAFRSWLGSIIVSQVRMRLRKNRFLATLGLGSREPVDLDSIASESAGPEIRAQIAQLYALLRMMPADERIAWTLRHVERHSLEEVAELVCCSLATAKRRLLRAQQFLQSHFVGLGTEVSDGL